MKLVRGAYHPHELDAHNAAGAARPSPSISPDAEPPVWREKRDTDYTYNECVRMLLGVIREDVRGAADTAVKASLADAPAPGWLEWVWGASAQTPTAPAPAPALPIISPTPRIGVLFGTHNWESCALILKELVRNGLAVEDPAVEGGITVSSAAVNRVAIGQLYGEPSSCSKRRCAATNRSGMQGCATTSRSGSPAGYRRARPS